MNETSTSAEEKQVRASHAAYIHAVNAADLERVLGLMTDDVVLINPGQAPFGRDAFPVGFRGGHETFELRCESEIDEVVVAGDVAYTRCHDSLFLTPRDGGVASTMAGYRLSIYRRQADGRWLLARDMHALAPVDLPSP